MNLSRQNYIENDPGPTDIRMMTSTGPFNLRPTEISRVVYSISFALPAKGGNPDGSKEDLGGLPLGKKAGDELQSVKNSLLDKVEAIKTEYYKVKELSVKNDNYNINKIMNSVYPNPASSNMTVDYTVENTGNVEISILDQLGRELNLFSGLQNAGNYVKTFELNSILNSGCILFKN